MCGHSCTGIRGKMHIFLLFLPCNMRVKRLGKWGSSLCTLDTMKYVLILGIRNTTLFSTFLSRSSFLIHSVSHGANMLNKWKHLENGDNMNLKTYSPSHSSEEWRWRKYLILSLKKLGHPETCFCYDLKAVAWMGEKEEFNLDLDKYQKQAGC